MHQLTCCILCMLVAIPAVFSPDPFGRTAPSAYTESVSLTLIWNGINWCGHKLRLNHAHPLCHNICLGRTLYCDHKAAQCHFSDADLWLAALMNTQFRLSMSVSNKEGSKAAFCVRYNSGRLLVLYSAKQRPLDLPPFIAETDSPRSLYGWFRRLLAQSFH